jgi:hypothetical protein
MKRKRAVTGEAGDEAEIDLGDGAGLDLLPERLRRTQRFGGVQAAALAEAEALRREIDALAARLAQAEAGRAEAGRRGHNQQRALVGQEHVHPSTIVTDEFPVTDTKSQPVSESLRAWLALRRAGLAVSDAIARLAAPQNAAAD